LFSPENTRLVTVTEKLPACVHSGYIGDRDDWLPWNVLRTDYDQPF
jgi:hypothetical protein